MESPEQIMYNKFSAYGWNFVGQYQNPAGGGDDLL